MMLTSNYWRPKEALVITLNQIIVPVINVKKKILYKIEILSSIIDCKIKYKIKKFKNHQILDH